MRRPTPDKSPKREEPYDFSQARYCSIDFLPYLYSHVASLVPVPKPGLGTMGVDEHMRIYYDPAVFDKWTLEETTAVILHEDLHALLCHADRCRAYLGENITDRQWADWNVAGDLVINQTLEKVKDSQGRPLPLPAEGTFLKDFGFEPNLSVEEYYELLAERNQPDPPPGSAGTSDEEGDQDGPESPPDADSDASDGQDDQEDSQDQDAPGDGSGPEDESDDQQSPPPGGGSAADGRPRPWEDPPPDQCDTPGVDTYNQEMLQRDVAEKTEEWESQHRGTVPGYLERFAEEILRPKVDPFKALRAAVRASIVQRRGQGNYTYRQRCRRNPPGAAILPGAVQPIPRAAVIADTSGSMGSKDLAKALGVVKQGLRSLPVGHIQVVTGDTSARTAQQVFRAEDVTLAGGGGTDMGKIVEEAADQRPAPDAIIVVTDGDTPWPSKPVRPQVVACLTRIPQWCDPPPAWITTVVLKD